MLAELAVLIVLVLLIWGGLRAAVGPRIPMPGSARRGPAPRRDAHLFQVADRRRLPPVGTASGYNRPADIRLPDDRILDPPREIEGRFGE